MRSFLKKDKVELLIQLIFWPLLYTLNVLYYLQFPVFNRPYLYLQFAVNYLLFCGLSNLFYHILVPKVLRRHWWLFILLSTIILVGIPLLKQPLDVQIMRWLGEEHLLLYNIDDLHLGAKFLMRFPVYLFWAALAVFIRLLVDWFKAERQHMELRNRHLSSELAFLRAQVNPHFLFNTLNNIYSLAYKKSEHTPEAVLKLSAMMRYMLYESNEEKAPLQKEIDHLQHFIDLQKLRLRNEDLIRFSIEGDTENKFIVPLLLMPIVENAFKHGNTRLGPVCIALRSIAGELRFTVGNYYLPEKAPQEAGGLGLQNIRRRLELLYPKTHELNISQSENYFELNLRIPA